MDVAGGSADGGLKTFSTGRGVFENGISVPKIVYAVSVAACDDDQISAARRQRDGMINRQRVEVLVGRRKSYRRRIKTHPPPNFPSESIATPHGSKSGCPSGSFD